MKHSAFISSVLLIAIVLCGIPSPSAAAQTDKYQPNWDSLNTHPYPQWFTDAKVGIFIHWGLYSVPSWSGKEQYAEWFLRGLQLKDPGRVAFQNKVFGPDFDYRQYAPLFKAELFDPDEWAQLFHQSGAKYIILVSKHHDGYCLWPSKYAPDWNSVDVGPKRDIVGQMAESVRKKNIKLGLYYSLTEWNNPLHRWYTDPDNEIAPYVDKHMIPQFKELISAYKPSLIFSDGEWSNSAKQFHAAELIAWYYNLVGPDAIVNNRWGGGSKIGFLTPEYSSGMKPTSRPWTEVRGLGRSFGLNRNEKLDAYMSPQDLIHFLIQAVANGGGITINLGPQADGQIPLIQQERMIQLGQWLKVNGPAIYGSKVWTKTTEYKDVQLSRIDPTIDFNWVRNTPGKPVQEDNFTAQWTGFIKPNFSEEYLFEAVADDGMRLWVDNKLIINKWKKVEIASEGNVMSKEIQPGKEGRITLKANKKYTIKIEYFEEKQNASIHLSWSSKSQQKQIIPQSNLYSSESQQTPNGLRAVYKSKAPYMCYTQNDNNVYAITLQWPGPELILPIEKNSKNVIISLLGSPGNLKYRHKNGKYYVDTSKIYHNNLPCSHAWTFKIQGLNP